ncbi:enoyl-CoA hydratase/isomerase family protein [Natronobacterium gregoryi]|uniref:3-hydroxybutyryl-CoA dehydratase n=2 Tax=Natronobacterium gregoryi TaxID=44930 RepID=L0AF66_NATGS|nr:enoyl-CoA hydratase-related protein [Natronobacterium gregoryi]AFZ72481.1 enoyl-CoA hydratase/carnithine racemase [Natronobacterium gregoryi SP2]ELY74353.1 short chain enoyl-CoA hydratase [Natronobacterium gregoryi SP2]PLK21452.1 3-hydroxybutyryl-CoA dehydratase [Natronobacterium gregoryi SP2]SFI77478.1 short chain enoyl-CoA hydratase [Natronobacterium gregoryi]
MSDDRVDGAGEIEAVATNSETIRVSVGDRVDGVATVTMDRPDARNALDATLRAELKKILGAIEDSDVRVVVLTGADEAKAFVAGADVSELRERDALEQREASKRPRVYEVVDDLRQPVIGRLNGHALGGGCELATACDVRIAHERAKVGQPEIALGIMPGGGGTQRLPRLVGEGQAMRLILSGELLEAREARDIGLVDVVCADNEELDEEVYGLAESMAQKSPVALEFAKQSVKAASRMDLESGIEYEAELFAQLFATADKNEGIDAFLEDRDPEWQGR